MTLLVLVALLQAQNATPRPGFRAAPPIYQQNCGTCHDGQKAPSITDLQQYSPERIYDVLTTGKMKDQAAQVSDVQKRQIAEFLSGRPMGSDEAGDIKKMTNPCPANPPIDGSGGRSVLERLESRRQERTVSKRERQPELPPLKSRT